MKVLFAVSDEKDAQAIIRVYQKEYKEIVTSKTVYYFNAIIKELQKDKTYDRIVISEDVEMFASDNYQAVDKFIFDKMDAISDEATNAEGNDIPIILLGMDRRTKNDPLLVKLFGLGLYNVLIGQDRSLQKVASLMYKPRTKKEAKAYYKVETEKVNYVADNKNGGISESEIQNILNHYKKIGNNIPKCVQSFDSIVSQYSKEQVKLIIQVLPNSVKVILEENSDSYRKIMGIKGKKVAGTSELRKAEYVEKEIDSGSKLTQPVIIPTAVNTSKVSSNLALKKKQAAKKVEEKIANEKAEEAKRKEEERIAKQKAEEEAKRKEEERIAKQKAEEEANKKEEERKAKMKTDEENEVITTPKRGRGRPRKTPVEAVVLEDVPVKKKRGRPRKNPIVEETEKVEEKAIKAKSKDLEEDLLAQFDDYEDDVVESTKKSNKIDNKNEVDEFDYDSFEDTDENEFEFVSDDEKEDENEFDFVSDDDEKEDENEFDFVSDDNEKEDENEFDFESDDNENDDDFDYSTLDEDDEDIDFDELEKEMDSNQEDVETSADDDNDDEDEFEDYEFEDDNFDDIDEIDSDESDKDEENVEEDEIDEDDDFDYDLIDDEESEEDEQPEEDFEEDDDDFDLGWDDEEENEVETEDLEESEEDDDLLPGIDDEDEFEEDTADEEREAEDDEFDDDFEDEEEDDVLPGFDDDDFEEIDSDEFEDTDTADEINKVDDDDDEQIDEEDSEENTQSIHNGAFKGISNKNYKYDNDLANSIKDLKETEETTSYNVETDNLITSNQKIVAFVGTTKNGTSFIVNNLAEVYANRGIKTAILDLTKNKNSYYIYTNNEDKLREKAQNCLDKLLDGYADGVEVNKNLTIFTSLPGQDASLDDVTGIIKTLLENYSVILLDCDFDTDVRYFRTAQEMYLVQSLDVLTIQPLTAFLRDLKVKEILETNKLRIIINKNIKVNSLTEKVLIGGMSVYNDPSMTYMTELFNKDTIKYATIPFENQVYVKYLEGLVNCDISLKGYSKNFISSLNKLADMVYPTISGKNAKMKFNNYSENKGFENAFSKDTSSILNKMKKKY